MIQWAEISSAEDKNRFEALGEVLTLFKVDHEGRHFTPERGAPYEEALREAKSWARTIHFRYPFVHVPVRSHLAHTNTVEWLEARDALVYERAVGGLGIICTKLCLSSLIFINFLWIFMGRL